MQRITINRQFYFEGKNYQKGDTFLTDKPFNACPDFITVEIINEVKENQGRKRKRAKPRNVAILNKDK